jgi:hypothetical protein
MGGSRLREPYRHPESGPAFLFWNQSCLRARNLPELGCRNPGVCNPYWMQHLVRLLVSEQLGNGNKVGSPVSTLAGLPTPGVEDCP